MLPTKSEPFQLRVVVDRCVPLTVIQVPGAISGMKLAPFTTPPVEKTMTGGITNTHAAPTLLLSPGPPMMTVLPSADSATEPWTALPTAPVPTSLPPSSFHTPPERAYTQAAPTPPLSWGPPTTAVFPSADSATEAPCSGPPWPKFLGTPVPSNLACWFHTPPERAYTHAAPADR